MSYIKIEKDKLVNLEFALDSELIRSNRAGSYASTTLVGCNTRKYHGLLVSPLDDGQKYVLLSSLDETVIQREKEFRLGIHQYPGDVYYPHGHRYLTSFEMQPMPSLIYVVGGVILKKELLLVQEEECILVRYTVLDAHSPTTLRLVPFLAFRNIHSLSKENMDVITKWTETTNGIQYKMYENLPYLYMQTSKKAKFITAPQWNKNILYREEQKRGYDYLEDLFNIGYFEVEVIKDEVLVFSTSLEEVNTKTLNQKFNTEIKKRTPRNDFENNLKNSANQFFLKENNKICINAGFHWYSPGIRETLLSLTGLTLYNGELKTFLTIFETLLKKIELNEEQYGPDIPLLLFKNLQSYAGFAENCNDIWKKFGKPLLKIFNNIKSGFYKAELHDNGLLFIPEEYPVLTWMNEYADGKPVTPRNGFVVEVNALWYNALQFLSGISEIIDHKELKKAIGNLPEKVNHFFNTTFINDQDTYLFDFVNDMEQNDDLRPNQIFALSLPYSTLTDKSKRDILYKIEKHLLTKKGLRSLSPKNPKYIGRYQGNEVERSRARHQGTVHPWLIGEFCAAWLYLFKEQGLNYVEKIYNQFEEDMSIHGLGSISELYDGNPPHTPNGAISYAPSIAALLNIKHLIDSYKQITKI
jgi:predicted glycogen debranching enzyme